MKKLLCLLTSILFCLSLSAQGLGFKSIDKQINERPSLILFHQEKGLTISKSMQIDFDLRLNDRNSFGYIILLKNKENNENFSLTYSGTDSKTGAFKFNTDGVKNHFEIAMPLDSIENKWHKVSILFDLLNNKTVLSIDSFTQNSTQFFAEKLFSPLITMGRYEYVLDVPDFQIRNLNVNIDNSRYEFPLNENCGSNVHTSKGEIKGIVTNPYWLINEAYNWSLLLELKSPKPSGFSFDQRNQQFIFFNKDSLKLFSLPDKSMQNLRLDAPVEIQLGTHFINKQNKLFIYELNNLPKGDTTVAYLDLMNFKWHAAGIASLPVQLHHHNGFYDERNHRYIIFGGFGNKRYSNAFYAYDIEKDKWDRINFTGDTIPPRFFSGMALKKDSSKYYIFGGMGNHSGDQTVGRIYYHDLFEVSLENNRIKKLWEIPSDKRLVSTKDMILSKDENYIYALCYPEYLSNTFLQLYRIHIESGEMIPVGDSISMCSEEIATSANLYHNEKEEVFYCVIQEYDKSNRVQARVYSIKDSPVSLSEMRVLEDNDSGINSILLLKILSIIIISLFLFFSLLIRSRSDKTQKKIIQSDKNPDLTYNELSNDKNVVKVSNLINPAGRHNSIFVFGPFTLIDRNGRNITHLFSTRLKLVFIYILLHSKDKGVLSISLNQAFWPDKTDSKVKNLKGVTINQIRKNLSDIDGIDLVFEKGYFKLNFTDCYCDLIEFENLKESRSEFYELNQILIRGKFLDGIESDIFDSYKLKMEEYLILYLPLEIQKAYSCHKYDLAIRYCNMLFNIDAINEKALFFYIHSMNKLNLSQDAIFRYSIFSKEYRLMMDKDYFKSYNMILASEPAVL